MAIPIGHRQECLCHTSQALLCASVPLTSVRFAFASFKTFSGGLTI